MERVHKIIIINDFVGGFVRHILYK